MSDTSSVTALLRALRTRVRRNQTLQELPDAALIVAASALLLAAWDATMPVAWSVSGWWLLPIAVAVGVRAGLRLRDPFPLWMAARRADDGEALHDELTSAHWFEGHQEEGEWVRLHLERATGTAGRLDPVRIVPAQRPRRLGLAAGCMVGALAFALLPVPRVFEPMVDRLGEIAAELSQPDDELVAELEETTDRSEEDLLDERAPEDRLAIHKRIPLELARAVAIVGPQQGDRGAQLEVGVGRRETAGREGSELHSGEPGCRGLLPGTAGSDPDPRLPR